MNEIKAKITQIKDRLIDLDESPCYKRKNRERKKLNIKLRNLNKKLQYKMDSV